MNDGHESLQGYKSRRGSALVIVLWVIALLSFLVITTLMLTMQDADSLTARKANFRARQLAEMGLAVAVNPQVKRGDPLLRRHVSKTESYEVIITSEEARLNLNSLLTGEESLVLQQIFQRWGLPRPQAEALIDKLMDWTDPDEFRRLKGAERPEYTEAGRPDRPYNRPFQTLDEAALVSGMEELEQVRPDWRNWFTIRGSGRLDVNEASSEMLAVLTGSSSLLAQALVAQRDGQDGISGTDDDSRIGTVEEAVTLLGGCQLDLSQLLAVDSTTLRIRSIGHVGDYSSEVAVTLDNTDSSAQILEWHESVVEP
jgi:type II secretory pathway component PulK